MQAMQVELEAFGELILILAFSLSGLLSKPRTATTPAL